MENLIASIRSRYWQSSNVIFEDKNVFWMIHLWQPCNTNSGDKSQHLSVCIQSSLETGGIDYFSRELHICSGQAVTIEAEHAWYLYAPNIFSPALLGVAANQTVLPLRTSLVTFVCWHTDKHTRALKIYVGVDNETRKWQHCKLNEVSRSIQPPNNVFVPWKFCVDLIVGRIR